jgi:polyferredoxin
MLLQRFRLSMQILFAILCIWVGIEFYLFIKYFETGGALIFHSRPPGVEGFLPISSLMSFYYFLKTGEIHSIHPAGFFIFIAIITISFFFSKSFCSWLCPIGLLSEQISKFSRLFIKKKIIMPKYIDYPMRSIKYLLLAFLLWVVLGMSAIELKIFLDGGYNIVADMKMYYFFAHITLFSLYILIFLFIASFFINYFWCRYLCPYGALLGIIGLFAPFKIKRNAQKCINCKKCTKVCPANIKVENIKYVISDECTACSQCIDVCPVKDTLNYEIINTKVKIKKFLIIIIVGGLFILITSIGRISNHWHNNISKEEYMKYYKIMDTFSHH